MMPRAGGQSVYLREALGPLWGFLYGWTLFLVIQTGTIAAVSVGFARYFGALVPWIADDNYLIPPLHLSTGYALSLSTTQFVGIVLIAFLTFWGLAVIADSPLFSTLVAQNAPPESRGSALTMVNCIGFAITIVSIELISALSRDVAAQYIYMLLAIGPVFGLMALIRNTSRTPLEAVDQKPSI
jgi:amino acid transporter